MPCAGGSCGGARPSSCPTCPNANKQPQSPMQWLAEMPPVTQLLVALTLWMSVAHPFVMDGLRTSAFYILGGGVVPDQHESSGGMQSLLDGSKAVLRFAIVDVLPWLFLPFELCFSHQIGIGLLLSVVVLGSFSARAEVEVFGQMLDLAFPFPRGVPAAFVVDTSSSAASAGDDFGFAGGGGGGVRRRSVLVRSLRYVWWLLLFFTSVELVVIAAYLPYTLLLIARHVALEPFLTAAASAAAYIASVVLDGGRSYYVQQDSTSAATAGTDISSSASVGVVDVLRHVYGGGSVLHVAGVLPTALGFLWCRMKRKETKLSILFGATVGVRLYPFAMLGIQFLMGSTIWKDVVGICVAHVFVYLLHVRWVEHGREYAHRLFEFPVERWLRVVGRVHRRRLEKAKEEGRVLPWARTTR